MTTRYLYGNGVDELFGRMSASGTAAWYLTDHLGSVRDIANISGTVIDHIKYDSFGKVISESSPSNGDRFKYTGRELDQNGLYYYRARYYDAAIGRFLAEDPLRFQAGDANLYRYVGNSPTFVVDPTGQAAMPAIDRANGPYMENPVYREWLANQSQSTGGGGGFVSTIGDLGQSIGGAIAHPITWLYTGDGWNDPATYAAAMQYGGEYLYNYSPIRDVFLLYSKEIPMPEGLFIEGIGLVGYGFDHGGYVGGIGAVGSHVGPAEVALGYEYLWYWEENRIEGPDSLVPNIVIGDVDFGKIGFGGFLSPEEWGAFLYVPVDPSGKLGHVGLGVTIDPERFDLYFWNPDYWMGRLPPPNPCE